MKVIIAGGRDFTDYQKLCKVCDYMLSKQTDVVIISGTAYGADKLGERYAQERGYSILRFSADWKKYGKAAGYVRNVEMAEVGDALIAFWNGRSKGTKHMIDIANNKNLKVKISYY